MNEERLKRRTKHFALRALKLANALPKTVEGRAFQSKIANQKSKI